MANTTQMDSLKKEAIRIYSGMIQSYPHLGQEEALNISGLTPKFNGCFAVNNSTVCFVSDDEVFVTPSTTNVLAALSSAGFRKEEFYVPFSNGGCPKVQMAKWNQLWAKAHKVRQEEFTAKCASYCDQHNIGKLSDEILQNCFEMPKGGVEVRHLNYEDRYAPIIDSTSLGCTEIDKIGHYCANNGKVVFVYRDGKTYVTKGYGIIDELRSAGYTQKGLFVPFSNGEVIVDQSLRKRWESIQKVS